MSDVKKYIQKRALKDRVFALGFEEGYAEFKIGVILRQAREAAGLTQDEVARRLKTKKSAISRIENHADDVRLSTLRKYADAVGANLQIRLASLNNKPYLKGCGLFIRQIAKKFYFTSTNSTSNTRVAFGGMTPPAPRSP